MEATSLSLRRLVKPGTLLLVFIFCLSVGRTVSAAPTAALDPAATLERGVALAEASLREGEVQVAESRYRSVLLQAWFLVGTLNRIDGKLPEALEAFSRASSSAVDNRQAIQARAIVHLQMGDAAAAVSLLRALALRDPADSLTRRLLARALTANGQPEQGVRELEEAHDRAPDDLEVTFALAAGYLRIGQPDAAARLFAQVLEGRPIPQTHILIGRAYEDLGELERAEAEYRAALRQDPKVRRAHYSLGLLLLRGAVRSRFDAAAAEFEAEAKLAPDDPIVNLELGAILVETRRPEEALPPLELVARETEPRARTYYYLGRAQLALDRTPEAVTSLKKALALAQEQGANDEALRLIHNQLGRALQRAGQREEAVAHFDESQRLSAKGSAEERENLERYLAEGPARPETTTTPPVPVIEASPLTDLAPAERAELERQAKEVLARTYFNLGVMKTQRQQFARAAEMFGSAAAVDPDFPQVQSSLGVALFNDRRFQEATAPLTRALADRPADAGLRRLLAMAWLNAEGFEQAADLLRDDAERLRDPSLQFAYGLALVRSQRSAEAEKVFSSLLASNQDSPELNVLLGQAHAQQGDFNTAVQFFERALEIEPDVPEANAGLGVIYLKQGRLEQAERALRGELKVRPDDLQSQQNLAVVLEATQRPDEALALLGAILDVKPDFADARYLVGKILLGQGNAAEAVVQLEAAARVAPEDSNIRYQLARAYQKDGRAEQAKEQFEVFRQLKAARH
jgi:tetratricopeptide (TPR) repeat protein